MNNLLLVALRTGIFLTTGILCLAPGCSRQQRLPMESAAPHAAPATNPAMADVTVPEDLMREHGVLRRVLLIYDECIRRIAAGQAPPAGVVADSANIIRTFVEGYHEKLEDNYLFPRFEKAGVETELVATLRSQHDAGRRLTAKILQLADDKSLADPARRERTAMLMAEFSRMYRPHAAREDTVLFPAIRRIFTPEEFDKLGDTFEDLETKTLGEGGFERMVLRVETIEKRLGIERLSQFTPPAN